MSELNLIKCMNHMNEILLKLENFIDEEIIAGEKIYLN